MLKPRMHETPRTRATCAACGRSAADHEEREMKRCTGALRRGMRPLVRGRASAA